MNQGNEIWIKVFLIKEGKRFIIVSMVHVYIFFLMIIIWKI
jgi:hypothetical protein